jgi:hypothetical protein
MRPPVGMPARNAPCTPSWRITSCAAWAAENDETVIAAAEAAEAAVAVAATAAVLDTPLRLVKAAGEEGEVGDGAARRAPAVAGRLAPAVVGRLVGGLADAGRERAERDPLLVVFLLAGMFRLCGNTQMNTQKIKTAVESITSVVFWGENNDGTIASSWILRAVISSKRLCSVSANVGRLLRLIFCESEAVLGGALRACLESGKTRKSAMDPIKLE